MADKRMFSKKMISSDAFLDMPLSTQGLFFHLAMNADDDGIVDSPKKIMRECGAKLRDLNLLIEKRYLLIFPSGVVLIKHWKIHNTVPKDRYTPSTYTEEMATVIVKDNKSYTERIQGVYKAETECKQVVIPDKSRLDKSREEKISKESLVQSGDVHDTDSDLEEFYESIWELYPIKKGRGQVSKTKKKVLQRIGYDEIKRCVERFLEDMETEGRDKKYWMHGSTFFNSGYVDYLDKNQEVEPAEEVVEEIKDRFSCLDPVYRAELEEKGAIDGQSLNYGNLTEDDLSILRESGVEL